MDQFKQKTLLELIKSLLTSPTLSPRSPLSSSTPFYCYNYNEQPSYISDGQICLQIILPHSNKQWQYATCKNQTRTPFYNAGFTNYIKCFNCLDSQFNEIIKIYKQQNKPNDEEMEYTQGKNTNKRVLNKQKRKNYYSVYHPAFHYRDHRLKEFVEERDKIVIKPNAIKNMLYVVRWELCIVNVMDTPSYAPIIRILEFESVKKPFQYLLKIPTSILFDEDVMKVMIELKTKDLKEWYKRKPIKLEFTCNKDYENSVEGEQSAPSTGFLTVHDSIVKKTKGTAITFEKQQPKNNFSFNRMQIQEQSFLKPPVQKSYIYIGCQPQIDKFYFFKKPMGNTFKNVVAQTGDTVRYDKFYEKLRIQQGAQEETDRPYYELLDDDEQSETQENGKNNFLMGSQSEEEEEDPLRMLYKKMMNNEKDKNKGRKMRTQKVSDFTKDGKRRGEKMEVEVINLEVEDGYENEGDESNRDQSQEKGKEVGRVQMEIEEYNPGNQPQSRMEEEEERKSDSEDSLYDR